MTQPLRTCKECQTRLPPNQFGVVRVKRGPIKFVCRAELNIVLSERVDRRNYCYSCRYQSGREQFRAAHKRWQEKNPERFKELRNASSRALRQRRKQKGLCNTCGERIGPGSRLLCIRCYLVRWFVNDWASLKKCQEPKPPWTREKMGQQLKALRHSFNFIGLMSRPGAKMYPEATLTRRIKYSPALAHLHYDIQNFIWKPINPRYLKKTKEAKLHECT